MLPSLGLNEMVILAVLALLVVGPKDLPLLFRKIGRWTAKLRGMAQEFRTGFDELARQAELDELKREVDALRKTTNLQDIGRELSKPFTELQQETNAVLAATAPPAQQGATTTDASQAPAIANADASAHSDPYSAEPALMDAGQLTSMPQPTPSADAPEAEPDHAEPVARSAP